MIAEFLIAWVGWSVWRRLEESPGTQQRRADRAIRRAQGAELRSAVKSKKTRRNARANRLNARVKMMNVVEGALRDVHQASGDEMARMGRSMPVS
jgi:hypothetical protein